MLDIAGKRKAEIILCPTPSEAPIRAQRQALVGAKYEPQIEHHYSKTLASINSQGIDRQLGGVFYFGNAHVTLVKSP